MEIGHFTQAIATGKDIPALVTTLQERDQERARIVTGLARLDALDHAAP